MDLKTLSKNDPLKRNAEKGLEHVEHSPMDPPSAYEQPGKADLAAVTAVPVRELMEEHKHAIEVATRFENALIAYKAGGYKMDEQINKAFAEFYRFVDDDLLPHNDKEEKHLFPLLREKLIANGEHSVGEEKFTAIEVMEDDHVKFIQLSTLSFNLLGLATRIRDEVSRIFILDHAYESAREFVELLKLHIYREDVTLFPLAEKYFSEAEMKNVELRMHGK
ncbi:MAG: hemerythrin domain-containing protein [Bacteroidia bacterium]|nr:hemerythrin domain-containing protein [Bacteroidia bacterium]